MSELVNREQLTQKLRALNTTQQSIEGTANWCLFYHREAKTIVSVWDEEFHHTSAADKKIAQLYLANHLLQEGKKKGREFGEEYSKVIYKAIKSLLHVGDEKARKAVERLVGVWDERRVFGSGVIKSLREAIARAKAAPPPSSSSQNGSQAAKAQQPALVKLTELWTESAAAKDKSSQHSAKALQLKPKLHLQGSMTEIIAAKEVLTGCGLALQTEIGARERTVEELRKLIVQQEEGIKVARTHLDHYREQQELLKNRAVVLESVAASTHKSHSPPHPPHTQQQAPPPPFPQPGPPMPGPGQPPHGMPPPMPNGMGMQGMGMPPPAFPGPGMMGGPGGPLGMLLPPADMMAALSGLNTDLLMGLLNPMANPMGQPMQQGMIPQQSLAPPPAPPPGFNQPPMQGQPPQGGGGGLMLASEGSGALPRPPGGGEMGKMPSGPLPPPHHTGPLPPHAQPPPQHMPAPPPPQPPMLLPGDAGPVADVAKTLGSDQHAAAMLAQALAAMPEAERQRLAQGLASASHAPPPAPPPPQDTHTAPQQSLLHNPPPPPPPASAAQHTDGAASHTSHTNTNPGEEDMALDDDDYDPDNPF